MKQNDWLRIGKMVLYGAGIVAGISVALCMLLGIFVGKEWITVELGGVGARLLVGACMLLSCYHTAKRAKQNRLPVCFAVAIVYWVMCLLCKSIAFSTYELEIGWWMLALFGVAAMAGVLASQKPTRRR